MIQDRPAHGKYYQNADDHPIQPLCRHLMTTGDDRSPPATCGQGLAEHAPLHGDLAEFMASMASNLAIHMATLDLGDPNSRREHQAYASLLSQHRDIAERLTKLSREMAGYRDLPMGRHDEKAMSAERVAGEFHDLVERESRLLESLRSQLETHRMMLGKKHP